jgi:hypothetical protein
MSSPDRVNDVCALLSQGDVLAIPSLNAGGSVIDTPLGVAILSQTCDVVRGNRPNLIVAPVVSLKPDHARAAREGERPRWVHLPELGDEYFVDLEFMTSVEKAAIVDVTARSGIPEASWDAQRRFARAIGRRFSRLALADEVVPWFSPLLDVIKSKHDKPSSPLFRALEAVTEFRIESMSGVWEPPALRFTLHIIVRAGELPVLDDDILDPPQDLAAWLSQDRPPSEIAQRLFPQGERPTGIARDALWRAFGDALVSKAHPSAKDLALPGVADAVAEIRSAVVGEEDFTLWQWRRSDELDLAHLSGPTPVDQ